MSDKLSSWLSGEGLLGSSKKTEKPASPTTVNESTSQGSEKPSPSKLPSAKPQTGGGFGLRNPQSDKPKPTGNRPTGARPTTPRPNGSRPAGSSRPPAGAHRPKGHSVNRQGGQFNGLTDKRDPNVDRPTAAKRDSEHSTNEMFKNNSGEIKIVPVGGMEQVGENMMYIEWGEDIIVIDTGFVFGGKAGHGVDVYIPDISYLVKNKHRIKAVLYTHGHLDHVGGVPYILPKLGFPPVYATRMTKEFVLAQGEEFGINKRLKLNEITVKSKLKLGKFEVEFFHINHSIPDGVGIAIKTPYGYIVNTSDFKIDYNPSDGQPADLGRLAEIGSKGVAVAMVDSTNAMKPGKSVSESVIEENLYQIIKGSEGRVIVASFSSNVGRVAQLIQAAERCGRTVFIAGRSMERNIAIARKTNHINCKDRTLQRMSEKVGKLAPNKTLVLTTGSQGEELAGLTRMADGSHKHVKLNKNDTVVFSSSPIPGNEQSVNSILDNLVEHGVTKIDNKQMEIHSTGHGHAEECKLMTALLNPKYFAPIHGEIHMRFHHKEMIKKDLQYPEERCFVMRNGRGLILSNKGCRLMLPRESVSKGDVPYQNGIELNPKTVEDRKKMDKAGLLLIQVNHKSGTINDIKIKAVGFCYRDPNHKVFGEIKTKIKDYWVKNYDPARSEKTIAEALVLQIDNLLDRQFRMFDRPMIEVVI